MFPGGTEGHCISVQKCFSQGMYNMLVKQILMNEGFVSPLMVLLHLFLSLFCHKDTESNGNQSNFSRSEMKEFMHNTSPVNVLQMLY